MNPVAPYLPVPSTIEASVTLSEMNEIIKSFNRLTKMICLLRAPAMATLSPFVRRTQRVLSRLAPTSSLFRTAFGWNADTHQSARASPKSR
jgi:hypothetical protein